jgi:ASC-1-like (ASCH) protein
MIRPFALLVKPGKRQKMNLMTSKTLWVKDEYLKLILEGRKTVEVRVGYRNIARLQVGDQLLLNAQHPFVIRRIGRYASFQDLIAQENPAAIAPDLSAEELEKAFRAIYPPDKQALGIVALEIARVDATKA